VVSVEAELWSQEEENNLVKELLLLNAERMFFPRDGLRSFVGDSSSFSRGRFARKSGSLRAGDVDRSRRRHGDFGGFVGDLSHDEESSSHSLVGRGSLLNTDRSGKWSGNEDFCRGRRLGERGGPFVGLAGHATAAAVYAVPWFIVVGNRPFHLSQEKVWA